MATYTLTVDVQLLPDYAGQENFLRYKFQPDVGGAGPVQAGGFTPAPVGIPGWFTWSGQADVGFRGYFVVLDPDGVTPLGQAYIDGSQEIGPAPSYGSPYATVADMVDAFGTKLMIEVSANTANPTEVNEDRVNRFGLTAATNRIHMSLGMSRYSLPLTGLSEEDATFMRDLACRAALVALYALRLGRDLDKDGRPRSPAVGHDLYVRQQLGLIATGLRRLSAARRSRTPSGVAVARP